MMHECPKCGFVQPKDRYCANCGLDIDSYKPAPDTVLVKFKKNTGLQITVVVGVILAMGAFIYISQKDKLEKHLAAAFQRTPKIEPETLNDSPPNIIEQTEEAPKPGEVAAPTISTEPAAKAVAESGPKELIVTFAEIPKILLQQLVSEGQILNETAQTRSFVLGAPHDTFSKVRERDPDLQTLTGGDTHSLRANTPVTFDFTHIAGAAGEDVGMNLQFLPVSVSDNAIELELTGMINLKNEAGASLASTDINANYVFGPRSLLVLVGFIPHSQVRQEDQTVFSNTPLAIYDSPNFLNNLTEFAIFIQAK